jgi:hypothetical protein
MDDDSTKVPPVPELPGEAAPGAYGVRTENGVPTDPGLATFPIVRYDTDSRMHLIGTGFFIATNGLFVTARHVLMDPFDSKGRQQYPIGMVQFRPGNTYYLRPILRCALHPTADVTVGVAAPMKHNQDGSPLPNPRLTLTTASPAIGSKIATYAYPKHVNFTDDSGTQTIHLRPAFYDGEVQEYLPNGRDRVMLPGPCYRTNILIHAGASGGPVFDPNGYIFGVNSTGFDGTDLSYVSRINEIFQLVIDDIAINDAPSRSVPVIDLARLGVINVVPPPSVSTVRTF